MSTVSSFMHYETETSVFQNQKKDRKIGSAKGLRGRPLKSFAIRRRKQWRVLLQSFLIEVGLLRASPVMSTSTQEIAAVRPSPGPRQEYWSKVFQGIFPNLTTNSPSSVGFFIIEPLGTTHYSRVKESSVNLWHSNELFSTLLHQRTEMGLALYRCLIVIPYVS